MAARERGRYLATNLTDVVTQQGRSLSWLGERLGVHRSHVSRIAAGKRPIGDEGARICSESLGVPVWLLFEETDEPRAR